jgi:hypothetical protein
LTVGSQKVSALPGISGTVFETCAIVDLPMTISRRAFIATAVAASLGGAAHAQSRLLQARILDPIGVRLLDLTPQPHNDVRT